MSEYDTEMMPHPESAPQFSSPNENALSTNSPSYRDTVPTDFLPRISMTESQKLTVNHGQINHLTYTARPHVSQSSFSRSSAFCTTLHVSSPTSSDTNRQLGIPFLPFLPTSHPTCADNSVRFSMGGEMIDECGNQNPDTRDFLEIGERSLDDKFEDFSYSDRSLALTEEEVGYLSEELHRAINESSEFPRIDEIYEEQYVPTTPISFPACDGTNHFPLEQKNDMDHPGINLEATNKPRVKWTSELHQLFLDAVNKLGGLEKATPKNVLLLMNVEGLNIYNVKSHLQKYRLTNKMEDLKQEYQASSKEKGSASTGKDGDAKRKRGMLITEALRMQIEFQKQLHEQLEVQTELQSRIEKQGEYLQEILEQQKKAGKKIPLQNLLVSSSNGTPLLEKAKDDIASPKPQKQKAVDYDEAERSKRQKLVHLNDVETG